MLKNVNVYNTFAKLIIRMISEARNPGGPLRALESAKTPLEQALFGENWETK